MEPFIQKTCGLEVLFIKAMGAVLQSQEEAYLEGVKDIIRRVNVTSIYIAIDTSYNFIEKIVHNYKQFKTSFEKILETIIINNYITFENMAEQEQKVKLA